MRRFLRAGLAAAGLAAAARAQEAAPAAAPPSSRPPLEVIESGAVAIDTATGAVDLEGGAHLTFGVHSLRAPRTTWQPRTRTLEATGGVLLSQPGQILSAGSLRLTLGGAFEARQVRAWLKEPSAGLDLGQCRDPEEAGRAGANRVTFSGERLSGEDGSDEMHLEGARLTPCDCGKQAPSWEIRARRADIEPGKQAVLQWPVLYVTPGFLGLDRPVPVLGLPWGYLPLADRKSGLLIPELSYDRRGFTYGQPIFWAAWRGWDATATPSWSTGTSSGQRAADHRGVRGPGLGLEARWAPAEGTAGEVKASWVHSTLSDWPGGAWRPPGGDRLALEARLGQRLGQGGSLHAEVHLLGDPFQAADFPGDLVLRQADYRRSALALAWRGSGVMLAAQADLLQPVARVDSGGYYVDTALGLTALPRAPFGWFGTDLSGFHRLPSLSAELLPRRLLGPLRLSARAELARFAPLRGSTGDEGSDGIGPGDRGWGMDAQHLDHQVARLTGTPVRAPRPADAGERDGRWQEGERLAGSRALARAELRAPLPVGPWLAAEPWLAATAAGYAFEAVRADQASARLSGGLALASELSRRGGAGEERLLHVLQPAVELRFGTRATGPVLPSGLAFDEQDVAPAPVAGYSRDGDFLSPRRALSAVPPGGYQQLRLALRSHLVQGAAGPALDAEMGQDLDLSARRRAEAFAGAALRWGPLAADAGARFYALGASRPAGIDWPKPSGLDSFSELHAAVQLGGPRGDVHASFQATGPGGSQRLAAGTDPLFDPRPLGVDPTAVGRVGFRLRWSAAQIDYDADFLARDVATPATTNGRTGPHVMQHTARAAWESPCHCFRIGLSASVKDGDRLPSAALIFDLGTARSAG